MTNTPNNTETFVLVAEITGDNSLLDKIGAVETQHAVERSRKRAERSIEAYQGFEVSADGRRFVAHFPRNENAVFAAFDMRARVKQLPPVSGVALSVHVVIHATHIDDASNHPDPSAIALANKLVSASPANQILISAAAYAKLPNSMRIQLVAEPPSSIAVPGYTDAMYAFPAGITPVASGNTTAPSVSAEVFSPTSTSLSMSPPGIDTTSHSESPVFSPAANAPQRTSLMLRHNNNNLSVSDHHPVVLAGREEGNDLVIADRRASRHHSRIEWRHNHFVLIDTSTNGTFMVDDHGNEVVLRRGEADLLHRGRIGFGYSPTEVGAEVVFFDLGQR
jgi:adenylate cyclase